MILNHLFEQQECLYKNIMKDIEGSHPYIAITGNSGCGKSHLTEHIICAVCSQGNSAVLRFVGDIQCIDRDYFPIISGLSNYCNRYNIIHTIKKSIPKLFNRNDANGIFLEYITNTILNSSTDKELSINQIFSVDEIDLIYKMRSCIANKNTIIYLDNLHWWDKKSIHFIYLLFKYLKKYITELKSAVIICNITDNQENPNKNLVDQFICEYHFKKYSFKPMSLMEYQKCLLDMGLNTSNQAIIKLLYKLTNQHLSISQNALTSQLSDNILSNENLENIDFMKILIEKKLSQLGATGDQISEVLKFGSLIGLAFSVIELEYLVPYEEDDEMKQIINKASEIALIEPQQPLYRFSHEIIRNLFRKKLEDNKFVYYRKLVLCCKTLHPYDYALRIKYLLKIGDIVELEKLYCLNVCKMLEQSGFYEKNMVLEIVLSSEIHEYEESINKTYKLFQEGHYSEAITAALCIENIYPIELLAMRDLFISQCMTKSLENAQRQKAVKILLKYKEKQKDFSEEQIWSKTMMCLMAAYIHIRDIYAATEILDDLYDFYSERTKFCEDYKKELNVLRRKATPFYELEVAKVSLSKAVTYFSPTDGENAVISYPIQYFMALVNYSSNRICSGTFSEAFQHAQIAIDLYNTMKGLKFPRIEIAINNYLLAGYLSKNIALEGTISSFHMLLEKVNKIADKTIIQTNLAALFLMDMQIEKAYEILNDLLVPLNNFDCKEFSYIYHIKMNLLLIAFIRSERMTIQKLLTELEDIVLHLYQNYYFVKKHELLKEWFTNNVSLQYKTGFEQKLLEQMPFSNSAWYFYGLLPAFNTLEYWSEA